MNPTAPVALTPTMPRRTALAAALLLPAWASAQKPARPLDVPYVPTPMPIVQKMLELGKVSPRDTLYDLGCGDGRIVVTAAKERGARGVGIDIDPTRIAEANANALSAGVTDRTRFVVADLFESDFSAATVVTLYLLPEINLRLRPQLWRQLRAGTIVVSHSFDMGADWPPEQTVQVDNAVVYQWTVTKAQKSAA